MGGGVRRGHLFTVCVVPEWSDLPGGRVLFDPLSFGQRSLLFFRTTGRGRPFQDPESVRPPVSGSAPGCPFSFDTPNPRDPLSPSIPRSRVESRGVVLEEVPRYGGRTRP